MRQELWQGLPLMSWPPHGRDSHHETRVMRDDVMSYGDGHVADEGRFRMLWDNCILTLQICMIRVSFICFKCCDNLYEAL